MEPAVHLIRQTDEPAGSHSAAAAQLIRRPRGEERRHVTAQLTGAAGRRRLRSRADREMATVAAAAVAANVDCGILTAGFFSLRLQRRVG